MSHNFTCFQAIKTHYPLTEIGDKNAIYANYVHRSMPRQAAWELLGKKKLSNEELQNEPVFFRQNQYKYTDCCVICPSKAESVAATYEECIGLEREMVFGEWWSLEGKLLSIINNEPWEFYDEMYRLKIPGVDIEP